SSLRWWQCGVVYQIYPRSFKDSNGDGVGDLNGIIEKLDFLNDGTQGSLGMDAIWLSPFQRSPMADFGYDVSDYCDVDPLFGTLADFDRLVAETHKRGMKIIVDYVPNHTSDQHAWFQESRSSRDNPRRDWYIWRDPRPDGSRPNNWGSFFGGPAWTFDEKTGQYYLHQFAKEQPELNWRNPEVRKAMLDVLRFWLDRGVDGFRMDVIGLLIKDKDLRDNPPNPRANPDLPENDIFDRQLHIYTEDQDEVHEVIKDIRRLLDAYSNPEKGGDRCGIGELWGPLDRWVRYYGEHGEELHLPFNFRLMDEGRWDAKAMRRLVDTMEAALPPFAWPNYVLGNHDRIRMVSRFGGRPQARSAGMMLLTLRGTPTFYYGDEIGLENGVIPPEKIQDPQGLNLGAHRSRDVSRTPMQWDGSVNAGFSAVEPWLPVSADFTTRNVVDQTQDPSSMLNFYRKMFWLRKDSPALIAGSYRPVDVDGECFFYLREYGNERKLIALNFASVPCTTATQLAGKGQIALSTHLDRAGEEVDLARINLRANEGLIIDLA
ncbi:MAG TPA: alpha-amylase family glycosyl hydrolase, partial [Anaerolineaceae bacterium]